MEYPLTDAWNLFYDYNTKRNVDAESWASSIKKICQVETIPEFLYVTENVEDCDAWPINSNLHFFREGISPMWEDDANIRGGKWVIELPKGFEGDIEDMWRKTMAFCISELTDEKILCGCVYSPRRQIDRFSLWVSCTDKKAFEVGKIWKDILNLKDIEFTFFVHENAIKGFRERENNLYKLK
ncbi:Eukaryotic translation initiation factor 4E [Dictyocoela muelleri]|nr:Eukaryotic translation initiation factor 4E [Dictyocoela muelleri]